jgi:hypothetical protein
MPQARDDLDLLNETMGAPARRELRSQDFHRDLPAMLGILRQVDSPVSAIGCWTRGPGDRVVDSARSPSVSSASCVAMH